MEDHNNSQDEIVKPHFDISAYVVKQLGEQLVSDEVTALMELVKNSYDADASYVNIVINTTEKLSDRNLKYDDYKGYILIEDDGDGMTDAEIEKGWLTISVSKKRGMKAAGQETTKGRTPLGEKGLGRLSTQRLASKLELFTHNESEATGYHVAFNWDDFTEDALLSKVNVEITPIGKQSIKKGSALALLDIKDPSVWLGNNVERMKGKLSQLIFPKKRKRPFSVYLTINNNAVDLDFVSDNIKDVAVSNYSYSFYNNKLILLGRIKLSKLKGNDKVNFANLIEVDNGKNFFEFISNPSNKKAYVSSTLRYAASDGYFVDFKRVFSLDDIGNKQVVKDQEGNEIFLNPGNFRGKIDEYNFTKESVDITPLEEIFKEFSQYTSYIQGQTGIRVFRDGFGIRPFGLDGEDWLKLNSEQTSGGSFYGLRPGNIIGYVEIGAKNNPNLLEKTDREGIIDNFFYKNFYTLNKKAVKEINSMLEAIRRAYNEYRKKYGIEKTGLNSQVEVFNLMRNTAQYSEVLIKDSKELESGISEVNKEVRSQIRLVQETPLFASAMDNKLQPLFQRIEEHLGKAETLLQRVNNLLSNTSKLNDAVHLIEPQISTLQDQLLEFSQLAGLGIIAESLAHEMDNTLDNLVQKNKSLLKHVKDKKYSDTQLFIFSEYVNTSIVALRKQLSSLSPSLKYLREEKSVVDIGAFAEEIKELYQERLANHSLQIVISKNNNFKISVNKGKLTQIFVNIILNSIYWLTEYTKTTKINPEITIVVDKPFVKIFDNGLGINPEIEARIFQPFVTSKPKTEGRGLGLFIVQQIVDFYGCDLILSPERNAHNRRYIFQINFDNIAK